MFNTVLVRLVSLNITATPDEIADAIEVAREYNEDDDDVCDHAVASVKLLADNGMLVSRRKA